jgi:hypothetical protein
MNQQMKKGCGLFFLLVILTSAFGCASVGSRKAAPCLAQETFPVGKGWGVIFPAGSGSVEGYGWGTIKDFWTPAREDIIRAETGIVACLQDQAPPPLYSKFSSYVRQYTGFYLDNRKLIFVQFFCIAPSPDWKCVPVVVLDGGDCYFHLEYDLNSGSCRKLWINGSA